MMRAKICYVVTVPITIRAFFIPQLKYLAENGFDVSVVCSKDDFLQKELGEKITYYPMEIPRGMSLLGSLKAIGHLIQFFKEEKFDLVQYSTPNAAMYASIAGRLTKIQVRNYHLMGFRYLGATGISKRILKMMEIISCRNSTHIECVSKSNLEIGINEKIFEKDKAVVVWNGSSGGVDLKRFDYSKRSEYRNTIRLQYGISKDDFVFGFIGRITRDKGVNEILEAFCSIKNAKLLMVGNVEEDESLNSILYKKSLSNPNIVYTGLVSDVEKYYASIDVLLLPSYREGFGNVIIEAAAMGTPAIVSNIPGPIDAIEAGETALVVNAKDVESLLKAMKKIMMIDYKTMGRQAERFVRVKFDSDILCRKILERKVEIYGKSRIVKKRALCQKKDSTL